MYALFKPAIFALDPEHAHDATIRGLSLLGQTLGPKAPLPGREVQVGGLHFANPIGLAAGLDKDACAVSGFSRLGFGHLEVGTVTPRAQPGNPKPRIFRLTDDLGLINRFGFNNQGVDALVARLSGHPYQGVLGVNIGKNKDTDNDDAAADYVFCLKQAAHVCDYMTVNLSSPNTPGLRDLADATRILDVIKPVLEARGTVSNRRGSRLPIFVKLAPDFTDDALSQVLEALIAVEVDAVILTNTTVARSGLRSIHQSEVGGLSGAPLRSRAEHCLRVADSVVAGRMPIIAVGGIMSVADCQSRLALGASLVQLYTGLIYRGPGLVKAAVRGTH